jgi:hypothetical protein
MRRTTERTINGRILKMGYRLPFMPKNPAVLQEKRRLIRRLTRTSRHPYVRIRHRGSARYWLIKPMRTGRWYRNKDIPRKEGLRLKSQGSITSFKVTKLRDAPWYSLSKKKVIR